MSSWATYCWRKIHKAGKIIYPIYNIYIYTHTHIEREKRVDFRIFEVELDFFIWFLLRKYVKGKVTLDHFTLKH